MFHHRPRSITGMFRLIYIPLSLSFSERDFNMKKNQATLFLGVIDGQNYLLDVNDSGSYHAKGGQYIVIVAEDSIKVWIVEPYVGRTVFKVQDF